MRYIALLFILFPICTAFANRPFTYENRATAYIKVWGFLKYYHPAVTHGTMNWDSTLLAQLDLIKTINSKEDFNDTVATWLQNLNLQFYPSSISRATTKEVNINSVLQNILDTSIFDQKNIEAFRNIATRKVAGTNRFVNFENEIAIPTFTNELHYEGRLYPSANYRLLALARYWNIVEYFYPYKSLVDKKWDVVLTQSVPNFIDAKDSSEYYFALAKVFREICDTHAELIFNTKNYSPFGSLYMQYSFKIIDGKVIVTNDYYNNDSLAKIDNVRIGDRIVKIDNKDVAVLIENYKQIVSASNNAALQRSIAYLLTRGRDSIAKVLIERDGLPLEITVYRYSTKFLSAFFETQRAVKNSWQLLEQEIGYVNLKNIDDKSFAIAMKKLRNTQHIIFDLRGLNKDINRNTLARFLSTNNNPFCNYYCPNQNLPGHFVLLDTMKIGMKQKPYYHGNLIVLVNEYTQSAAEYYTMMFKTFPNVKIIGSQTAGTDGDVRSIKLPGGYTTLMTGGGVFYPNNSPSQRIGIVPDYEVQPTIEGIKSNKDEILEFAIKFAITKK